MVFLPHREYLLKPYELIKMLHTSELCVTYSVQGDQNFLDYILTKVQQVAALEIFCFSSAFDIATGYELGDP